MTDDTQTVVESTTEGAAESQSAVSQKQEKPIAGAPQSSQELSELNRKLVLLESELRGLQSRTDKNKDEVERFMEDVKARMASGASLEEAEKAVKQERKAAEKDDLLYKIAQKVGVLGNSSQGNATDEVAQVLERYGVSKNDPVASRFYDLKGDGLRIAVADYALEKAKIKPPDSSEAASLQGAPASQKGLMEEYQKEVKGLRGNAVIEKKMEFRKRGLDIN